MDERQRQEEIAALEARLADLRSADEPVPIASRRDPASLSDRRALMIVPVVLLVLVVGVFVFGGSRRNADPADYVGDNEAAVAATPELAQAQPADPWHYVSSADEMRDAETKMACVYSREKIVLTAPYKDQELMLCVRRSPQHGLDVYLRLELGGQFMCRSYQACTIKVRADEKPVQSFSAIGASDGSPDVIFIQNASRMLALIEGAQTVRVEAEYYRAGNQAAAFPTGAFDSAKVAP